MFSPIKLYVSLERKWIYIHIFIHTYIYTYIYFKLSIIVRENVGYANMYGFTASGYIMRWVLKKRSVGVIIQFSPFNFLGACGQENLQGLMLKAKEIGHVITLTISFTKSKGIVTTSCSTLSYKQLTKGIT